MKDSISRHSRWLLLAVAAALIAWGTAGFIDARDSGRGGWTYSPEYIVNYVSRGGPGEEAGLRIGDRVLRTGGIPVEELPLYSRWPRSLAPNAGESLRVVVEREGETLVRDVVYGETPRSVLNLRLGAAFVGLSFMGFGLWVLFAVGTRHSLTLATVGLAAGAAIFGGGGPYLGTWDGVASHLTVACSVLWSLLLLRFFLTFPEPKRVGASRLATRILYGVWVASLSLLVLELIFHPALYHTFGSVFSLLILGYCLLALISAAHTLVSTAWKDQRESGMTLIYIGILVGVVPTLAAFLPGFRIAGASYLPLLLAAIPLFMALAVRRRAQAERAAD